MASNGSPEAFLNLTVLSETAFYSQKEANGACKRGVDILSHESSNAIVSEYNSEALSDTCKTLVLTRLLSLFLSKSNILIKMNEENTVGFSYKFLLPVMKGGLESAKRLERESKESSKRSTLDLLNNLWERVCLTLSRMLTPIVSGSRRIDILFASDLVVFVNSAATNATSMYSSDLCAIFFSGASKSLEIAKMDETRSETIENFLDLFASCFSGMCKINPDNKSMHGIAEQVLLSAIQSLKSDPTEIDLNVKATLKICDILQKAKTPVEDTVIALSTQLSQLVCVEERSIRRAAGAVLAKTNFKRILIDARNRAKSAEESARKAGEKASNLEKEMATLRRIAK